MSSLSVQDWLLQASLRLIDSYSHQEPAPMDRAQQELIWLIEAKLRISRTALMLTPERTLTPGQQNLLEQALIALEAGEPLAYVLGEQPFWTLNLKVSKHTLIPRSDTELLVETALTLELPTKAQILDLGTGTGAIALALARERPSWHVMGTDLLPESVALAVENAQRHKLERVCFTQSHWYEQLTEASFDLICSNPPYIAAGDPDLDQQVLKFEPVSALIANNRGLEDIEIIITGAHRFLKTGGYLLLEHGWKQAVQVQSLFAAAGFFKVKTVKDYSGRDRMTWGTLRTPGIGARTVY